MAAAIPAAWPAQLAELEGDGTAARLRTVAATLTPEEYERLHTEAAEGDHLAQLITAVLASSVGREGS